MTMSQSKNFLGRLAVIALLIFAHIGASAQMIPPANWSHKVTNTNVKVGDVIEVVFKTDIPSEYHIYSNDHKCPDLGPNAAEITYEENASFKVLGLPVPIGAKSHMDDTYECEVSEFHNKAEFRQKIKILSASPVIKANMEYQMCTEEMCTFKDYEFEVSGLTVTGGSAEITAPTNVETSTEKVPEDDQPAQALSVSDSSLVLLFEKYLGSSQSSNGSGAYVDKADVDYATFKRKGDSDTATCETKTFEGKSDNNKQSYWLFFFIAFLSGLAALLTPCVFPMIPMTVSFFMKEESRAKAIRTGLIYGASIIGIYVLIGSVVAVTAGPEAANFLSTHWIPNVFFFLIFVIFAASFFGAFELTLPSWLVNKVDKQADKGGLVGVFFMAFTIVLVSFSCTGPIVGSILVESAGGEYIKPLVGMFGFSLAFAIPFAVFAIFPSMLNTLPQSGGWLNSVKVVLGFLELAFGLKFLSVADQTYHWGILDREVYIGLWIVIFLLMGFYLLGKLKFSHDSDLPFISVPRLFMAIITFAFVAYLGAGLWGAPLKQLAGYMPPMSTHDFNILDKHQENNGHAGIKPKYGEVLHLPDGLPGYFDYEQGMEVARQIGKPVFLDFTGHGCVNCREMEARVWSDQRIHDILRDDYVIISLYVDDKTLELPKEDWYTSRNSGKTIKTPSKMNADIQACFFKANAQPQYALLDNKGDLLQPTRNYNKDKEAFLKFLKLGEKLYRKRSVETN